MTFKEGDEITYFPSYPPRAPRRAVFVRYHGQKARIVLFESDGTTRSVVTNSECLDKKRTDVAPALHTANGGFKNY